MSTKLNKIIDFRTGIVKGVFDAPNYPIKIISKYAAKKPLKDWENNILIPSLDSGLGYSLTSNEDATTKATGEALERYCASYFDKSIIKEASFNNLGVENKADPLIVTRYEDWQYNIPNFPYPKVTHNTIFSWVKGYDLLEEETIWVPSCLTHMYGNHNSVIRDMISTGLAAGSSKQQAIEGGILECIERDAIMIMWLNQLSMPVIDIDTIEDPVLQNSFKNCELLGLEIKIIDITTDLNIPTYFVIIFNKNGVPYISVAAKAHYDHNRALRGAVEEAYIVFNHIYHANLQGKIKECDFSDLNKASLENHCGYYALNYYPDKINFMFEGKKISFNDSIQNKVRTYKGLINKVRDLRLKIWVIDLTTEDVKDLGLHVYRTIMPELAFLEFKHPMLRCNRLKEVPKRIGYDINYSEYNTNPHPFP